MRIYAFGFCLVTYMVVKNSKPEVRDKDLKKELQNKVNENEVLEGSEEAYRRDSSYAGQGVNQENKWYRESQERERSAFEYAQASEKQRAKSKEREASVNDGEPSSNKGEFKSKGRTKAREDAKQRKQARVHHRTQEQIRAQARARSLSESARMSSRNGETRNIAARRVGAVTPLTSGGLRAKEMQITNATLQKSQSAIDVVLPVSAQAAVLRSESVPMSRGVAETKLNPSTEVTASRVMPRAVIESVQQFSAPAISTSVTQAQPQQRGPSSVVVYFHTQQQPHAASRVQQQYSQGQAPSQQQTAQPQQIVVSIPLLALVSAVLVVAQDVAVRAATAAVASASSMSISGVQAAMQQQGGSRGVPGS